MVKILLIRHGQTDWNIEKRAQGHTQTSLNKNGVKQAKELAEKLKNIDIKAIYSSTLSRALQTAEIISEGHNKAISIIKNEGLTERKFGILEGLTRKEFYNKIPDIDEKLEKNRADWKPPEGNSLRELQSQFLETFEDIVKKHKDDEIIAIVTHGGAIKTLLVYLLKQPLESMFQLRSPANCEVIEIVWNKDKEKIKFNYN